MTKKFKREEDLVERLEKENRELKASVRHLEKKLKKVDKNYRAELEEVKKEKAQEEDSGTYSVKVPCLECGKGEILEVDLMKRIFLKCTVCDFKARKK